MSGNNIRYGALNTHAIRVATRNALRERGEEALADHLFLAIPTSIATLGAHGPEGQTRFQTAHNGRSFWVTISDHDSSNCPSERNWLLNMHEIPDTDNPDEYSVPAWLSICRQTEEFKQSSRREEVSACAQTNATAAALIAEIRKEATECAGDVGGYAARAALRSLVEDWTTQDIQPKSLVSDMDDMISVLTNVRLRLADAVTSGSDRLAEFDDAQDAIQAASAAIEAAMQVLNSPRN